MSIISTEPYKVKAGLNMKNIFDNMLTTTYCISDSMKSNGNNWTEIAALVRKNHIIKYNNNYYRIDRNTGYLYPIINDNYSIYERAYQDGYSVKEIEKLFLGEAEKIGDPGVRESANLMLAKKLEKGVLKFYGVDKIELNPGDRLCTSSDSFKRLGIPDNMYHGSSYNYPTKSNYQPYSCLGNWYQYPGFSRTEDETMKVMYDMQGMEREYDNFVIGASVYPTESRNYDVSQPGNARPYIITNYKINETTLLYNIPKEESYNYFILHLQYFSCRINPQKNEIEIFSDKIYRDATGKPDKYNYTTNANLLGSSSGFCESHYKNTTSPSRGWYNFTTASKNDGDKALAAEICMKKNINPNEIEDIDGWYLEELLHLMRCGINKVEVQGFTIKLFEEYQSSTFPYGIERSFIEELMRKLPIEDGYKYIFGGTLVTRIPSINESHFNDTWSINFRYDQLDIYHEALADVCINIGIDLKRAEKIFNNCRVNEDVELSLYISKPKSGQGGGNIMYSKIINPKTGRKVNINSHLGQTILTNYISFISL